MLKKFGYGIASNIAQFNAEDSLPDGANVKGMYITERAENDFVCTIIYKYHDCNYEFK